MIEGGVLDSQTFLHLGMNPQTKAVYTLLLLCISAGSVQKNSHSIKNRYIHW